MKLVCCAVRDDQIGAFMQPSFFQSEGQAVRMFSDEVNRAAEDNILYKHPEDFGLYCLGVFHSLDGKWDIELEPRPLVKGLSVKK